MGRSIFVFSLKCNDFTAMQVRGPIPERWRFFIIMDGWIKLHKSVLKSAQFHNLYDFKIWIWLLCRAAYEPRVLTLKIGKGCTVVRLQRGQILFGRSMAERELGLDGSTIYRVIQRLQEDGCISINSNNQFSIITIVKFNDFQDNTDFHDLEITDDVATNEQPKNSHVTSSQQVRDSHVTHIKNIKKEEKVKKEKKTAAHLFRDSPYFDLEIFKKEFWGLEKYQAIDLAEYHESMLLWSASKGEKKLDWVATAKNWMNRDIKENKAKNLQNGTNQQTPNGISSADRKQRAADIQKRIIQNAGIFPYTDGTGNNGG